MTAPTLTTVRAARRAAGIVALALAITACGGSGESDPTGDGFVPGAGGAPGRMDDDPMDANGPPSGEPEAASSSDTEGLRIVDDPAVDDPERLIAEVFTSGGPDEVTVEVSDGARANVDIAFGDDGSVTASVENAAGVRAIEIDGGRWRRLEVRFDSGGNDNVVLTGDVPADTEVEVRTSAGGDRISLSGDLLAGAEVTLLTGSGDDLVRASGEVRRGAELSVFTGSGDDVVTFGEGNVFVSTGRGEDTITSTAARRSTDSIVDAGPGDDRIAGLAGQISGGSGRDTFIAVDADSVNDAVRGERVAALSSPNAGDDPDPTPARDEPEPEPAPEPDERPATSPSASSGVSGLRAIWYVGRINLVGAGGPRGVEQAVLEFDDGAVTTDVDTVVASGRRASRRSNPTEWGTSRVVGGTLRYRLDGSSEDVENTFTLRTRAARSNERLVGCFGSRRGFSSGGIASISVNTLCLDRRGRFSNDRAVATSNPAGSGSANSQVTGTYRLDGHAIRLDYDDGKSLETTFGVYEDDGGRIETLLVGERVLR